MLINLQNYIQNISHL